MGMKMTKLLRLKVQHRMVGLHTMSVQSGHYILQKQSLYLKPISHSCLRQKIPKIVSLDLLSLWSNYIIRSTSTGIAPDVIQPKPICKETDEPNMKGILFKDNEAMFHHSILENSSAYRATIFKIDPYFVQKYRLREDEYETLITTQNWESKSVFDVATAFVSLGVYSSSKPEQNLSIINPIFNDLVSAFVSKCSSFNEDQLIDCLVSLQLWPMSYDVKASNFLKVWKALDGVCNERYKDWSIDKILFVMDLWYQIRLTRLSNFVYKGLKKIYNKCEDLTSAQMVQTLFYMSCVRKLHPAIAMREYEHFFQKHIPHLSVAEIGIFAIAFFKTTTSILNKKILIYMMQRTVEELDSVQEITITAIAKAVRLSHKPDIGFTCNDFVKELFERRVNDLNLITLIHIAHISTQVQFYNQEPITKLAEKFCQAPLKARLKDMERVAFFLSLYSYIPPSTPNILDIIADLLDREEHVNSAKQHVTVLLSLLSFLSQFKIYPMKQHKEVLNAKYLLAMYGTKYNIPLQPLQIDYNRVVEGPSGSEHLLPPDLREYMARRYSSFIPDRSFKLNVFDTMMCELMDATNNVLGGEQFSLPTYPLPHFSKPDILFCLDKNGKPLPIPEEMRRLPLFEGVKRPPAIVDGETWHCVVIAARNMYMLNTPRLTGEQVTKLRQLKVLGYKPIIIPHHYWKGEKNRKDYLELKYFTKNDET